MPFAAALKPNEEQKQGDASAGPNRVRIESASSFEDLQGTECGPDADKIQSIQKA